MGTGNNRGPVDCDCEPTKYPYYCERHQCEKGRAAVMLCKAGGKYWEAWEKGVGPGQPGSLRPRKVKVKKKKPGLGDRLSKALSMAGITEERVSEWLGRPCGCAARRERLNRLGEWVGDVLKGRTTNATDKLEAIIKDK